jgi:hypothetical protein
MGEFASQWPATIVTDWYEFMDALEATLDAFRVPATYIFRGQADSSWSLRPSILRRMGDIKDRTFARAVERFLEEEFMARAHLFPETRNVWAALDDAASRIHTWAFMQHHFCPTRLLDWTSSAYVATYFAVDQLPETDGALFIVAPEAVRQYAEQKDPNIVDLTLTDELLLNPAAPDLVGFTWPSLKPSRAVAQQGHFSVNANILAAHDGPILEACRAVQSEQPEKVLHRKIVIPAELKALFLQQLLTMNVTASSLFPNLDGTGKSLADLVTLKVALYKADEARKKT